MKSLTSKLLTIFICLQMAIFPSYLFAASLGGWTTGNSIVQGASIILNGSKEVILNGASKIANGTAKITPNAAQVSKALAGGAAAVALDLAIKELLGAVDYVLDPANNSISYTKDVAPNDASHRYFLRVSYSYKFPDLVGREISIGDNSLCASLSKTTGSTSDRFNSSTLVQDSGNKAYYCLATFLDGSSSYIVNFSTITNPAYDPNAVEDNQPKSLPLSTVSQEIISLAAGGNASAQQAIKAAADTIVAEAETDSTKARPIVSQFENTSTIETSETATSTSETTSTADPAETATTDTTTSFPVFCNWAPTICQAAQYVITKPQTWADAVSDAWSDFWNEPDITEQKQPVEVEEKPIEQNPAQFDQVYVQFGGQCPTFETTQISIGSVTVPLTFDLTALCDLAIQVRPAILGLAYLAAMGIVTSAIREA